MTVYLVIDRVGMIFGSAAVFSFPEGVYSTLEAAKAATKRAREECGEGYDARAWSRRGQLHFLRCDDGAETHIVEFELDATDA